MKIMCYGQSVQLPHTTFNGLYRPTSRHDAHELAHLYAPNGMCLDLYFPVQLAKCSFNAPVVPLPACQSPSLAASGCRAC